MTKELDTFSPAFMVELVDSPKRNAFPCRKGKPEMYRFPGGYYSFDEEGKMDGCHLYVQDYQSNNRMVVNAYTNEVEQINHYYPYGALMGDISTQPDKQNFKYSGKELDRTYGLDLYDFHARQYDPLTPGFNGVDRKSEEFYWISPYAYCLGNPVNFVDKDGNKPTEKEGGMLINHVYSGKANEYASKHWFCHEIVVNESNGLKYGIYSKLNKDKRIEYALVFAGTEKNDYQDKKTDLDQIAGNMDVWQIGESGLLEKSQYGEAMEVAEQFASKYGAFEKTTLGHSLGAALCQVASMKTGIQAMAYNPAGLHRNTISNLGLTNAPTSQIQNYVINGDGVHLSNLIAPNVTVPDTTTYRTTMWSILFGCSPIGLIINHLANNF
ncbi:MAG: RHS repeat-associated core domain-containing protein [Bacteroidales bacterium]|nr:RHS repeat-associated core domain-containing protein [Bacteroidales bacterium]